MPHLNDSQVSRAEGDREGMPLLRGGGRGYDDVSESPPPPPPPPPPPEPVEVSVVKEMNEKLGIGVLDVELPDGTLRLRLRTVAKGSPAARCGVAKYIDHYLTHMNGNEINTLAQMREAGQARTEVTITFIEPSFEANPDSDAESELMEEHPQIVPDNDEEAKILVKVPKVKPPKRPKGGDSVAQRHSQYMNYLVIPVSMTMFAAVILTLVFKQIDVYDGSLIDGTSTSSKSVISFAGNPSNSESSGKRFGGALLNAVIITSLIVFLTLMFVCLYKLRCLSVMFMWLVASTAMVLIGVCVLFIERMCVRYQIALDWISFIMITYNFSVVGLISIYYRGHPSVTRGYHIATSAVMAWYMTRLPEWTTWCLLIIVAFYDIFAVCCGPLKVLVEESVRRDEPIPALVYESRRYKLGLGDFVFYSLLVARAASTGFLAWSVSFIGVLVGMCATLLGLAALHRPLPALPCSIFLGVALAFTGRYVLEDYAMELMLKSVHF